MQTVLYFRLGNRGNTKLLTLRQVEGCQYAKSKNLILKHRNNVYIAPSGVQKERMTSEDLFILDFKTKEILVSPKNPSYKISQCTPLFWSCYELRPKTRACIHTHSINAVLVTLLNEDYVDFTYLEMIKGIAKGEENFKFYDVLRVPIIENTAKEENLTEMLRKAIKEYPETNAVLVRRHGVYVWGESWEKCKSMAECYDYLFECFVKMRQLGFDASKKPDKLCDEELVKSN